MSSSAATRAASQEIYADAFSHSVEPGNDYLVNPAMNAGLMDRYQHFLLDSLRTITKHALGYCHAPERSESCSPRGEQHKVALVDFTKGEFLDRSPGSLLHPDLAHTIVRSTHTPVQ
ncbi:uncharacterized protein L201_005009 [Kwoniella dendrophila CBS 6074]|uniref:Uncharacterized protein n=1 Tax=Kwoniella dendrophila CBS 6074 TaxID=1295534 RepID=A0AAX4JXE8_9TREE